MKVFLGNVPELPDQPILGVLRIEERYGERMWRAKLSLVSKKLTRVLLAHLGSAGRF